MEGNKDSLLVEEIQNLVKIAKEFEVEGKLKESKNAFLDAASQSLKLSKTYPDYIERLTYENIARELVNHAKDLQIEIQMKTEGPLPQVPSEKPQKTISKSEPSSIDDQLIFVSEEGVKVTQSPYPPSLKINKLIVIKEGGIPVVNYSFEDLTQKTLMKLNDILFSGALTAINQIMMEVVDKPIQTISFEDGILLIHLHDSLYFVVFASEDNEKLGHKLTSFCEDFSSEFESKIVESYKVGRTLSDDEDVTNYIENYFFNN